MSPCCLAIIVVVLVVGLLIAYVLYKIGERLTTLFKKPAELRVNELKIPDEENEKEEESESTEEPKNDPEIHHVIFERGPVINCSRCKEADTITVFGVQMCSHLVDMTRKDKNTDNNIIYIHLPACLIVFIQSQSMEDESFEDDINYINSYTSKHIDISVYSLMYDRDRNLFVDVNFSQHQSFVIYTLPNTIERNLFRPPPSAPPTGNFIYIPKQ